MNGLSLPQQPAGNHPAGLSRSPEHQLHRLYFGEFSADVDDSHCSCLFRGEEPVALSDAPRKVLFILLQHRPRPVTGKALLRELWHAGANPSNVAKQVRALRRALGDEESGRYMRTLKKEGYAFVMPVTEFPVDSSPGTTKPASSEGVQQALVTLSPVGPIPESLTEAEWRLASEKLMKDFRGSCLHDLELLDDAIRECDRRIRLIVARRRLRLHSRFPPEPVFLPPGPATGSWAMSEAPDREIASRTDDLIRHSMRTPVVVSVGPYAPACIAVLQSLHHRYGLGVRVDSRDLSGRQQVLRLTHDDEADFLLAPHAPFLLMGEHHALDYRWVLPVHSYEQAVLRRTGPIRARRQRLLVYQGGSPEEQLMAQVGIPSSAEPELITSLEKLVMKVQELAPGDMVIAWEPLASGLESRHPLKRTFDFRCWLSLYCHKRWQRGAMRPLRNQFSQLFASEWIYCLRHREWAMESLAVELRALQFFAASGSLALGELTAAHLGESSRNGGLMAASQKDSSRQRQLTS